MALRRLTLRDFVLVDELELEVQDGFTVLTGETGAGKSILIDALQLVLGARADAGVVREGAERTDVAAEFDTPAALQRWLDDAGFAADDTLLLRRVVDSAGKSRAWINGSPATATQLREAATELVAIHGQHAWQRLTEATAARQVLDSQTSVSSAVWAQLALHWQAWRAATQALARADAERETLERERERLQWQIDEVTKLGPGAHEWPELQTEHSRLTHAQALIDTAEQALQLLNDDEHGALTGLSRAQQLLAHTERLAPDLLAPAQVLVDALAQASDAAHTLGHWLQRTSPDPERLGQLDNRLAQWIALARRYRLAPEELAAQLEKWRADLAALMASRDRSALQAQAQAAQQQWQALADQVRAARQQTAPKLAARVTQAMQGLGMGGGRFEVALAPADPGPHGADMVTLLVAGHRGSTPRPLAKVASGGELSRLALALAVVTHGSAGDVHTLLFDEIDAGVGGEVGDTVGRLLSEVGQRFQVLAVTHLPQVAACAQQHWRVSKAAAQGRTLSRVQVLAPDARTAEVARMLGGAGTPGDTRLAHAQALLSAAGTPRRGSA